MKSFHFTKVLLLATLPLGMVFATLLGSQKSALAQYCPDLIYMGNAVTGASVNVDGCSVTWVSDRSVDFTYYLGGQEIYAQAHCYAGTWTTFHDHVTHKPQSSATESMVNFVCGYDDAQSYVSTAYVFAPPSNVRVTPNGRLLCTVRSPITINIYDTQGEWYSTDVCGSMGWIHDSQVSF